MFLVGLGGFIAAAGLVLIASGVSFQDHVFDLTTITPGAIAAIGGLILIGLGLAVRVLQRIERSLAARPLAPVHSGELAAATDVSNQPAAVAVPFTPPTASQEQSEPTIDASAPTAGVEVEPIREKFPTLVRLEGAPVVAESDVAVASRQPSALTEVPVRVASGLSAAGANGSAAAKIAARPDTAPRPVTKPDRRNAAVFESLWPKGPRVVPQAPAAVVPGPGALPPEPAPRVEPRVESSVAAGAQPMPQPVSILKSGVVDGMAYTLYSDGSIEAQLPQGTLRFNSITELRNHVERGS